MAWLPVILITAVLSSSGVLAGYDDHGGPITFYQFNTFHSEQDNTSDQISYEVKTYEDKNINGINVTYKGDSIDNTDSSSDNSISFNNVPSGDDFEEVSEQTAEPCESDEPEYNGSDTVSGNGSYDDTELRNAITALRERMDEIGRHTDNIQAVEIQKTDYLKYICGILIFFLLAVLLKYIYKFFRIFF